MSVSLLGLETGAALCDTQVGFRRRLLQLDLQGKKDAPATSFSASVIEHEHKIHDHPVQPGPAPIRSPERRLVPHVTGWFPHRPGPVR
jgi:hypothetical protein